jgi:polyisoprenoid-binding protein YceI
MNSFARIFIGLMLMAFALSNNTFINQTISKTHSFEIDTANSYVNWFCTQHSGRIKIKRGNLSFDGDSIKEMSITLNMNTISNEDITNKLLKGTLENILKSPDFFHVEKYPEATFVIHNYKKENDNSYRLTGDIHILRNDICSTFPVVMSRTKDSIYLTSKPVILNRTDWGIYYLSANNRYPEEGDESLIVSDTIEITLNIKGIKAKN